MGLTYHILRLPSLSSRSKFSFHGLVARNLYSRLHTGTTATVGETGTHLSDSRQAMLCYSWPQLRL